MSKYIYFVIIVGALLFLYLTNRTIEYQPVVSDSVTSQNVVEMKTESLGAVDVEITPNKLVEGERVIFISSFNTHSVELDYDWKNVFSLQDDLGNDYEFIEWTGKSGGHHLDGGLVFSDLQKGAKELTLSINGIDGVTKNLVWKL